VYGASEGLRTLVIESEAVGGQAGSSSKIENYLGFPQGLSGEELAKRAYIQAHGWVQSSWCSVWSPSGVRTTTIL